MDRERIVQLVSEQLQRHHPGGVTLQVEPEGVRQRDAYWYVPVRPSAQPPKVFEYYEVLAEVEATIEENEQIDVFLVPVVPEEAVEEPGTPQAVSAP
jgi:hypothetical protein